MAKDDIELKGKEGLSDIIPSLGLGKVQLFDGGVVGESTYPGTYQDAIGDIQNGLLTGIIHQNGEFTWRLYKNS